MQIQELHIGQHVIHPEYDGVGDVKAITEQSVEVLFISGRRTLNIEDCGKLTPSGINLKYLVRPLEELLEEAAALAVAKLSAAQTDTNRIGAKWLGGKLELHPQNAELATKEIPIEVFLHKIVMVRDQLRVLEQKVNSHEKLNDAERVELQYYITRAYGSLSTFNVLFKDKEDHF